MFDRVYDTMAVYCSHDQNISDFGGSCSTWFLLEVTSDFANAGAADATVYRDIDIGSCQLASRLWGRYGVAAADLAWQGSTTDNMPCLCLGAQTTT